MVATVTNVDISISIIVINAGRGSCVSGLPRGAHWAWMPLWLGVGPEKYSPPSASPRAGSPRGESSKFWRTPGWWQQGAERSLTVVTSPGSPPILDAPRAPCGYIWRAQILLCYSNLSFHPTEGSLVLRLGMIHFCTFRVKLQLPGVQLLLEWKKGAGETNKI